MMDDLLTVAEQFQKVMEARSDETTTYDVALSHDGKLASLAQSAFMAPATHIMAVGIRRLVVPVGGAQFERRRAWVAVPVNETIIMADSDLAADEAMKAIEQAFVEFRRREGLPDLLHRNHT